ncbi:unnamed protein product [Mytilus edulis]|uniref:Chitin-binding type-2 domain-containing protein n=1 Tax=Mytilus edulis TaxID=6550 RepID=A0A8S3ST24_MYTED|nr:unnamed protein product [Mytilus edulis]
MDGGLEIIKTKEYKCCLFRRNGFFHEMGQLIPFSDGASSCTTCPAGQACTVNGTVTDCPAGTYNAAGETTCTTCASGYYSDSAGSSSCTICTAGYDCSDPALTPTQCLAGTFSNPGDDGCTNCATAFSPVACASGETISCQACSAGFYCAANALPVPCATGTYSTVGLAACLPCPTGQSCNDPAEAPVNCGTGYYSPSGQATCIQCPSGKECDRNLDTLASCATGSYSLAGDDDCTTCPIGSFCPFPSVGPIKCPSGTHTGGVGSQTSCTDCPAGSYCTSTSAVTGTCTTGYYSLAKATACKPCPAGYSCATNNAAPVVCASGTYSNGLATSCTACDTGKACPSTTSDSGKYDCPLGTPIPCPNGQFMNRTGYDQCFDCPAGYYCTNAMEPLLCSKGYYCPGNTTADLSPCPRGTYNPILGYYCPTGQSIQNPPATICPAGHYCPEGSHAEIDCPSGTYQDQTGQGLCKECVAGSYCDSAGLSTPTGPCDGGYYCPEGQNVSAPAAYVCTPGHYCPIGSPVQTSCSSGTYQDQYGQPCPSGYYCPESTGHVWQSCPAGTFNPSTGLANETQCTQCTGGFYCDVKNLTVESGPCDAGYFCRSGSDDQQPSGLTAGDAGPCPVGHYCPQQTQDPIQCPAGTFNNETMLTAESSCQQCLPGYYCDIPGVDMSTPTGTHTGIGGICPEGHFCVAGSTLPTKCSPGTYRYCDPVEAAADLGVNSIGVITPSDCPKGYYCPVNTTTGMYCAGDALAVPTGTCAAGWYCSGGAYRDICPEGYYCEVGSSMPTPCGNGTYMNHTGASACYTCPAGYYCVNRDRADICTQGYYCPTGTGADLQPCPTGSFGNTTGLIQESECKYCEDPGLSAVQGDCDPGFLCYNAANTSQPTDGVTGESCPKGMYCDGGLSVGVNIATPNSMVAYLGTGDICPAGYECPSNSTYPAACSPGKYAPTDGEDQCLDCPAGNVSYVNGAGAVEDCLPCPGGYYCDQEAQTGPTGLCDAGYYCPANDTTISPTPSGFMCPVGYYCPQGSAEAIPCPPGEYQENVGQSTCIACPAGSYCTVDPVTSTPSLIDCPAYHYCPSGLCMCSTYTDPDTICDSTCLATTSPTVTSSLQADGSVAVTTTDPVSGNVTVNTIPNVYGPIKLLLERMIAFFGALVLLLVVAVIVWRPRNAGIYPMKHWKPQYRSLGAPPPVPKYLRYDDQHWPEHSEGITRNKTTTNFQLDIWTTSTPIFEEPTRFWLVDNCPEVQKVTMQRLMDDYRKDMEVLNQDLSLERNRQLSETDEFAAALKEFSPGHDGVKEAENSAEELASLKHDLEKKRKEEEAKLKKEQDGKGFQEDKDTEWGSDDVLQPVDLNQLNARTFVVYKFGSFVADLVASRCRHAPVTILLANKIPPSSELARNQLTKISSFSASSKLVSMLGEEEDKLKQSKSQGVAPLVDTSLGELSHKYSTTDTASSVPQPPMNFVTANMTGHALWQTFVNRQDPDQEPEQPVQPTDTQESLQDAYDNLCEDFTTINKELVELQDSSKALEELSAGSDGKSGKQQSSDTTEKMATYKERISKLEIQKKQTAEKIDECLKKMEQKTVSTIEPERYEDKIPKSGKKSKK